MTAVRRSGFTLVETIAAIVIVAVALPPMLWAVRDAHAQRVSVVMASRARWLATEKLEDVIADRHSTTRGYAHLVAGNYPAEAPIATDPDYGRTVALSETEADLTTAGTGYMNVTVTVTWTDPDGDAQSLAVSTVVTEYAP